MYCGHEHEIKRKKCPAFGKTCTNCLKKNHFQAVCKFKKKNIERVEENQYGSLFSKKQKQESRKNWTEEKRHYTKGENQ